MICSAAQTSIPQLWDHKHTITISGCHFPGCYCRSYLPVTDRLVKARGKTAVFLYILFIGCRTVAPAGPPSPPCNSALRKPPWFSSYSANKDRAKEATGNRCAYYPASSWAAPHFCSTTAEWKMLDTSHTCTILTKIQMHSDFNII